MFLVVCAALAAGSLAGCGGGAAGGQAPAAAAPVEVVIAPVEPVAAPTAAPSAAASADAPKEEAAPDGDAVASMTPEERAKMEKELAQLDLTMLSVLSANGGSVNMGGLSNSLPLPGGLAGGAAGLSLGGGGGVIGGVPGGVLGGQAGTAVGGVVGGVPGGGTVKGPVAEIALESLTGADGVPGASATIAGMTAGFRRCYSMGLKQDPSMAGGVTLGAAINAKGEVSSSSSVLVKGLSAAVVACMKARLESASFRPSPRGAPNLKLKLRATAR